MTNPTSRHRARIMGALAAASLAGLAATGPARAQCELQKVAELPVTMVRSQPLVTVKINGVDIRMTIDSGAAFSMLTQADARRIPGLKEGGIPPGTQIGGIGGSEEFTRMVSQSFDLGGAKATGIDFAVGDLKGGPNLLGENILHGEEVEYDLAHNVIRLYRTKDCGEKAPLAYWAKKEDVRIAEIDKLTLQQQHIITTGSVNGARMRIVLDTGAARSSLTLKAAARAGIRPDSPGVTPTDASRGIGKRMSANWVAPVDVIDVGEEELHAVRLTFGEMELNEDMLLGVDFFRSHRVMISPSRNRVYFTYNGGPVFDVGDAKPVQTATQTSAPAAAPELNDAAALRARGGQFLAAKDYDHALADISHAIEMKPDQVDYYYDRGQVYMAASQPDKAAADYGQALKLKPAPGPALAQIFIGRAQAYFDLHRTEEAHADLDSAARAWPLSALPANQTLHVRIATLMMSHDLFEPAVAELNAVEALHPDDQQTPALLLERCRARALWNHDLDKAMADCRKALAIAVNTPLAFEDRGLVYLRMGRFDDAVKDFDQSVKLQPKSPWSLYGRGVAKLKRGKTAEGQADLKAAAELMPALPERAVRLGFSA
jgi:tetratricopeptide (TPR) repeat protein/predicted aspartyl protease